MEFIPRPGCSRYPPLIPGCSRYPPPIPGCSRYPPPIPGCSSYPPPRLRFTEPAPLKDPCYDDVSEDSDIVEIEVSDNKLVHDYEDVSEISQQLEVQVQDSKLVQNYDDVSESSSILAVQIQNNRQKLIEECPTDEDAHCTDHWPPPFLPSEDFPSVWMYDMEYPTDPPEYISGFHLAVVKDYTFEFMFPNLFRRMWLPHPYIPTILLYWTSRNPSVLKHLMEKFTNISLRTVVDSLQNKRAVRILFWKVGLTAMFGTYEASVLLRFAAFQLLKNDWESAFYLYIAAVIRVARKLTTLKNKVKCVDKDFGEVNPKLNVVRKHPRVKGKIIKINRLWKNSIIKSKSLVKKVVYVRNVRFRQIFKKTKETMKIWKFESSKMNLNAKDIANDLAHELDFGNWGSKTTDKDINYRYLFHECDDSYMKEFISSIVKKERYHDGIEEPSPDLDEDIVHKSSVCDKIVCVNFYNISCNQNEEHSDSCINSLTNPDVSHILNQVVNCVLQSTKEEQLDKCVDIVTMKQAFHSILNASLKSRFELTSRAHPILKFPLKYLDIDLCYLLKFLSFLRRSKDESDQELSSLSE